MLEDFIKHARTDRYNLMCSIVSHDRKIPSYEDDEKNIGYKLITKHVTTEAIGTLGPTFNFIDICLKLLDEKYYAIRVAYSTSMKYI